MAEMSKREMDFMIGTKSDTKKRRRKATKMRKGVRAETSVREDCGNYPGS